MNKKRVIMAALLAASFLFLVYKAVDHFDLLSVRKVGVLVVQDGSSVSAGEGKNLIEKDLIQEEANKSEEDADLLEEDSDLLEEDANLLEEDANFPEEDANFPEEDTNISEEDTNLSEEGKETLSSSSGESTTDQENTTLLDQEASYNLEVNAAEDALQGETTMFLYEELTQEIKDRIAGKSYGDNCKVPYDELRYVKVLYWGFDNETHTGELIVNKAIAQDIVDIFEELYEQKYPIERMVLVDEYDADDNTSMAANNTSAFNYRVVDGTDRLSNHSYGLAIDINPQYNPYVREMDGKTVITPTNGIDYADRSLDCEYYIKKDDICYNAFVSRGFTWGGDWKTVKDYQHFQKKID